MTQTELAKLIKRAAGTTLALSPASQSAIRRVMVYARASTKKQDMSIADQKKVLAVHISEQKDWECVGILEEVEKGNRRRKREQYQLLKQAMRDRTVDIVLVHEMSRLGRNFSELIRFLELAEQNGVELRTMRGKVDYVAAVALGLVADLQIDATSEQIKRAHLAINMEGLHIGTPPYGYRAAQVDGRKGHLAIHEEEAVIVQLIFKEYLAGKAPVAICRMLNDMRIPSPQNKLWRTSIITHKGFQGILHNVVYKGYVCYNMTEKVEDADDETVRHRVRPFEEWKLQKGKHTPIIDEADFDAAQERFANRQRFERKSTPGPLALFAGRIKCPDCMVVNPDETTNYGTMTFYGAGRDRQPRIRCSGVGIGRCNNRRSYIRSEVYSTVLNTLRENLSDPKVIATYLREHATLGKEAFKTKAKEIARLEKDVQRLTIERDNLIDAIAKGGDADLLNRSIAKAGDDILKAKMTLDGFLAGAYEFKIDPPSVDKYLEMIDDVFDRVQKSPVSAADKPFIEEINSLVERVVVHGNPEDRGFQVEIVGKLASIVTGTNSLRGESSGPKNIIRSVTLAAFDAAQMLTITYPRASATGFVPLHKRIEDLLIDDVEPVSVSEIRKRLAASGVRVSWEEVDRAIHYRREDYVNIRRQGFMLRSVYDRLPLMWFETTEAIIDAAAMSVSSLSGAATTQEIRKIFKQHGIDIHGDGDRILRKSMSRSGRFVVAGQQPTLWQLPAQPGAPLH